MSIIQSHPVALTRANINLRPLTDADLPLLYRWNDDPDVVYWADSGNAERFEPGEVDSMYGYVSQNALCFLAEVEGRPIGDCWLQKMNIKAVQDQYPNLDVRRIDATIGEKDMWGKGIGTEIMKMLIDFAFREENVDVLYCIVADYNERSRRMIERLGFIKCDEEDADADSLRAKKEYHYRLVRRDRVQ